ncbi:DUF3732 domain-containing protein [Streptomyces sp. NPDC057456]|uniref:DUF3732 domain-containing protein n=1 Tax=Streptomyces sp. NPDC057456 TaxID=3346139 RepID=UPI00368B8ABE
MNAGQDFLRRGLTVVADTTRGPVRLADMGGGENWLGYQVATLLSMHEWFSEQRNPVPRLLILDQPSRSTSPKTPRTAPPWPDPTAPPLSTSTRRSRTRSTPLTATSR